MPLMSSEFRRKSEAKWKRKGKKGAPKVTSIEDARGIATLMKGYFCMNRSSRGWICVPVA